MVLSRSTSNLVRYDTGSASMLDACVVVGSKYCFNGESFVREGDSNMDAVLGVVVVCKNLRKLSFVNFKSSFCSSNTLTRCCINLTSF